MKANTQPTTDKQKFESTLFRLRKCIGILGLLLPTLMYSLYGGRLASMSHYYYTSSGVLFIGILFSFGLLLTAYRGYRKKADERFSDDQLTSLAGFFAIVTVLIPTSCYDSGDATIVCTEGYLLGHSSMLYNTIHLVSAGLFILILGWMCIYKFTRSTNPESMKQHKLYKICGYIIWFAVGAIALLILIEKLAKIKVDDYLFGYVFILESVALYSFAVAWLIKGRVDEDIKAMKTKLLDS